MDSASPGFIQLLVLRNLFVSPALSILETVQGFFGSQGSKPDMERKALTVELGDISNNHESCPVRNPMDQAYTNHGSVQRDRIHELLNQNTCRAIIPINGSLSPNELPNRPKPRTGFNRWQLGFFGMLILFISSGAPLTALLLRRETTADSAPSSSAQQHLAVSTVTETVTATETTTQNITSVSTANSTTLSVETLTESSIRTSTYTESKVATTSGIGNNCDNVKSFLAKKNCVVVTECSQKVLDTEVNDCKDFCNVQPMCKKDNEGDMSQRLFDCCSHCGCF